MLDELEAAIDQYYEDWQSLTKHTTSKNFFENLKPTAVGWKVADREEYRTRLAELHDLSDKIIETWMNERWIAKVHLKDATLPHGITVVKLMERRPGSTDTVGLDHLDFYSPDATNAESILKQEPNIKWTHESNDVIEDYEWISIWFEGTEAKIKNDTVLTIVSAELKELEKKILSS
ncbi:MAG: hypothetical protein JWL85_321 [Candidatus Saccharibacteria bacterium]|nr:hypothetical protein [Candidatus Saccharibacteria bacterium]